MSAPAQSTEQTVVESLASYSPEAMRAAIEAARDPHAAAALAAQLEELIDDDPFEDFTATGLCVALGEAKAEAAVPVLLKTATRDDVDLGVVAEAAMYALRRMGPPAFEAAMRFIASEPDRWPRVCAYEVLCAATDGDGDVCRRVADFCFERATAEINQDWPDDWHPGYSVCEVLVWLRDPRAAALLKDAVEQTGEEKYETLLESFNDGDDPQTPKPDWRTDWPERCNKLADEGDFDEEDDSSDTRRDYEDLLEEFGNWQFATALPCPPDVAAGCMRTFIDLATTHVNEEFSFDNLADVRETLLELLPRKVSAEAPYFEEFPSVLEAFARFLHATGRLKDLQPLMEVIEEARTELPKLAADPRNWGMAKRLFMHHGLTGLGAPASGYDLDSFTRQVAKSLNFDLDAELREQPPANVEPTRPIRREAPKVGRNDPCPCGSGKKFKKCCGT
jgi:hypothetical protein